MPPRVVVDTSLILCSVEARRPLQEMIEDFFEQRVDIIVPNAVVEELKRLSRNRGRRGALAKVAIQLLRRMTDEHACEVVDAKGKDVDSTLIDLCKRLGAYLATADLGLKRKAEKEGISVLVYMKASKKLG